MTNGRALPSAEQPRSAIREIRRRIRRFARAVFTVRLKRNPVTDVRPWPGSPHPRLVPFDRQAELCDDGFDGDAPDGDDTGSPGRPRWRQVFVYPIRVANRLVLRPSRHLLVRRRELADRLRAETARHIKSSGARILQNRPTRRLNAGMTRLARVAMIFACDRAGLHLDEDFVFISLLLRSADYTDDESNAEAVPGKLLEAHAEINELLASGAYGDAIAFCRAHWNGPTAATPAGAYLLYLAWSRLRRDDEAALALRALLAMPVRKPIALYEIALARATEAGLIGLGKTVAESYRADYRKRARQSRRSAVFHSFASHHALLAAYLASRSGGRLEEAVPESIAALAAATYRQYADAYPCRVVLVSSSLSPGGGERQFATTASSLGNRPVRHSGGDGATGPCEPIAVVRYSSALNGSDFFRPVVDRAGVPLESIFTDESRLLDGMGMAPERYNDVFSLFPRRYRQVALGYYLAFRRHRPEVAHLWQDETNILGGIAALFAGVPRIVLSTRSLRPTKFTRFRRFLRPAYLHLLGCANVRMVNNSIAGARDYEAWLALPAGTVQVVHNGLDLDAFAQDADAKAAARVRTELGIPQDALVVGGCMRMSEEKRPAVWLEAAIALAARFSEAHFLCVGNGPLRNALVRRVDASNVANRVHLPGNVSPVAPWMKACDLLLNTSAIEGMPNVVIEAQSLGVPVVATDVGGTREVVIDGVTGQLVPPDDAAAVVEAAARYLGSADRRRSAATAARAHVAENFSIAVMRDRTLQAYGFELVREA